MSSGNKIVIAAFTKKAIDLASKISSHIDAEIFVPERFADDGLQIIDAPLSEWISKFFHEVKAVIFVSACGIAIRAIAPHITSKLTDPAVVVIDENGKFVIPILSGHIGGANRLAKNLADYLNAVPVITTATDVNNLAAVDEWAVKNNCAIENPIAIKTISSEILENHRVGVAVTHELQPAPFPVTLWLRPKNLILGVGCNRGVDSDEFEAAAKNFLESSGSSILSLKALASIDMKADEKALLSFADNHKIPFLTFTAEELRSVPGYFAKSEKVLSVAGVDNVCERACMFAGGAGAVLMRSKYIYKRDITFALARVLV
ncbi:MAG: cobalt-precorrin 5A hydrolase [Synergistaceae bacterium]|nr:cobalt-precorrin 5A hydrolase [Synergistaceae bacterium]